MTRQTVWPGDSRPSAAASPALARRSAVRLSVLAGDPLVASGLIAMLDSSAGLDFVDDARDAEVVVAVPEADLHMLLVNTKARLVLIADDLRQAELWTAIEHGLIVLVPRAAAANRARLLRAIADARQGRGDLPAEQLGGVLRALKHLQESTLRPRDLTLSGLSQRETEILRLLADGLDTAEMAERLIYSERTIKNILHNMLSRLDLRNRAHAVGYALRNGLI